MTPPRRKRIALSANTSWNIVNFRAGLVRALIEAGHEVIALAPIDSTSSRLAEIGCRHVPLPMDNKGTSPLRDVLLLLRFRRLLRRDRPDAFLGFTIKPNIYGSLAAHSLGIPVINNISGLGTAFIRDGWLTRLVKHLYRIALRRSHTVFFQNDDDRSLFVDPGLVAEGRTGFLPGSGVDLSRFVPVEGRAAGERAGFCFLLVARLLWDNGVGEYVEAARLVRRESPDARFQLLGFLDVENRSAIARATVQAWVDDGIVDYLGSADDVRPYIASADCVVLPSYREGTPRSLLEAAAMARPLIATDVPGCREVVEHGRNGFLCRVRNVDDLAQRMLEMIRLSEEGRATMGLIGRRKMEQAFDERIVVERYLAALNDVS